MDKETRIFHYISKKKQSLEELFLSEKLGEPETFRQLLALGCFYVNKKRCLENIQLQQEDYVRIHTKPKRFPTKNVSISSIILLEETDFYIVKKPSGIPVHATLDNYTENLCYLFSQHFSKAIYITQRLDVETEGLMILAKNKNFQRAFNQDLENKKVTKVYLVQTRKKVEPGLYLHYMKKDIKAPKQIFDHMQEDSKECLLRVLSVEKIEDTYHHYVELLTGRTHQIRAQFSHLDAPLLGDTLYGGESAPYFGLSSVFIQFFYQNKSFKKALCKDCQFFENLLS